MVDNRKIVICIPTWNRCELTIESIHQVINDERIEKVIICDDCSEINIFNSLKAYYINNPKVDIFRNEENVDCYFNKFNSIVFAPQNSWVILLDSDNRIDSSYIDALFAIDKWDEKTIYTADFAYPHFNFTDYSDLELTKKNIAKWIDKPMLEVALNASNYFVNSSEYIKVWDGSINPVTSDTIFMAMNWLKAGNKIKIVNGLRYYHRVWEGSHYANNVHRTPEGFHENILNELRNLW